MKKSLIFTLLLLTGCVYSQTNDSLVTVRGKVWYSDQYCMGTTPDYDIIHTSHEYPGIKFYLVKKVPGKLIGELILSFISDQEGEFSFTVPQGEYYISNMYPNIYEYQLVYPQDTESIAWIEWPAFEFNTEFVSEIQLNFRRICPPGPDRM